MPNEERTGTTDVTYDLMSIVYHALEAADTCCLYLEDVHGEDKVLAEYLNKVIEANRKIADDGKRLLAERLGREHGVGKHGGKHPHP